MAMKCTVLITILVVVLAASQTKAQFIPGIPSLILPNLVNITGAIFCSLNGTVAVNATNPTPPFPNAQVQLVCGGNVIASTTTNATGAFNIIVGLSQALFANILSSCRIVVATPLSACNATLPTMNLLAPLALVGSSIQDIFNITNFIPRPPFVTVRVG